MKKILTAVSTAVSTAVLTAAIMVFCIFGFTTQAEAKELQINVEFAFDADFQASITEYILYYRTPVLPDVLVEVTRIGDNTVRTFETPVFDLAPLSSQEYILSAVYDDGTETFSDPYPFRFTGTPTIIRIIIVK